MLKEFEFFHGVVFSKIFHAVNNGVAVARFSPDFNAGYVLDGTTGIYIKHCNKRLTPWGFSFQPEHLQQIKQMKNNVEQVFVVLVCNEDGIVCLDYKELGQLLDDQESTAKWIRVARRPRHMYSVTGSDGELEFKIGASDFPAKLFTGIAKT